jgi:hypothetical protein
MARVNTPKAYVSHMNLVKFNNIKKYKYSKKNQINLLERMPDLGFTTKVVNCPSLSNRDFYIHVKNPTAKSKVSLYSYFKWNNIAFKFNVFNAEGKKQLVVSTVSGEYKRRIEIDSIKVSKYRNFNSENKLARYLVRVANVAVRVAQTMIESYGKEALLKSKNSLDQKLTKIKNFVGLNQLVKDRTFAWRDSYYKNIEIRKEKARRYRNAMKIANKHENVKRTTDAFKQMLQDPNNKLTKILNENPNLLMETSI